MITVISPAKNMKKSNDWKNLIDEKDLTSPKLYKKSNEILSHMKEYITEEIRSIMKIKETLAQLNYMRFQKMKPIVEYNDEKSKREVFKGKTPSIFSYDGIQYKNIEVETISKEGIDFLNKHLRIISGFYGVLKPLDMIDEYRLEMQTKIKINDKANLYSFWGESIANSIAEELNGEGTVLNLASNEYSKTLEKYFKCKKSKYNIKMITCIFKVEKNGKLKVESTASKKARGKMVRYIAENKIDDIDNLKKFREDGFVYSKKESKEDEIVFIKSEKSDKKIAVIAGTPIDTKMGADFLNEKGLITEEFSVSENPIEQTKFQAMPQDIKESEIKKIIEKIKSNGIEKILVYCNSLSSAVDMEKLSKQEDITIITPMDAYKKIAINYNSLGVFAANNQGLAGIERTIVEKNKNCNVIGIGMLPIVLDVESKKSPKDIILDNHLDLAVKFFEKNNVEAIILGCTHFPYFENELKKYTDLKIINPSETMYELIIES